MPNDNHTTGLGTLAGRLGRTVLGALENRSELLVVEWQQEKFRLSQVLALCVGSMFLGVLGALFLTATVVFLFSEETRIYVAAAFGVLYLAGAGVAFFRLQKLLKREPFSETLRQLRKDRALLDSLE